MYDCVIVLFLFFFDVMMDLIVVYSILNSEQVQFLVIFLCFGTIGNENVFVIKPPAYSIAIFTLQPLVHML